MSENLFQTFFGRNCFHPHQQIKIFQKASYDKGDRDLSKDGSSAPVAEYCLVLGHILACPGMGLQKRRDGGADALEKGSDYLSFSPSLSDTGPFVASVNELTLHPPKI